MPSSTRHGIHLSNEHFAIRWEDAPLSFVVAFFFRWLDQILDTIDDVTVGYEGEIPEAEIDLLRGRVPRAIHFHVKRYNIEQLPRTDEEIGKWLQQIWDEKEDRLKAWGQRWEFVELFLLWPFSSFYETNRFDLPSAHINNDQVEANVRFQRRLTCLLWFFFMAFWSYCILAFVKLKFYVLLVCLFHSIMDTFANGVINFVCQVDDNYRRQLLQRTTRAIKQD